MFYDHLRRGALAGAVGGTAFGLFTAVAVTPLVAAAEYFEAGHEAGAHGGAAAGATGAFGLGAAELTSVLAGAAWGLLLGVAVFGIAYVFLEPALPGEDLRSYVLGGAGFLAVSGAPWLVLPPQPPGIEQALGTDVRLALYVGMVVAGALACTAAILAWNRLSGRRRVAGAIAPLLALVAVAALAPANPTTGALPASLAAAFRAVVVTGQLGLWALMAAVHARLDWLTEGAAPEEVDVDAPASV